MLETLAESERVHIFRALRVADGSRVILKIPRRSDPTELARLENELSVGGQLEGPFATRPLALDRYDGTAALVLKDFAGVALSRLFSGPIGLEDFLWIAIGAADALDQIHRQGVLHKDLKPDNLIVDREMRMVTIADFSTASATPREQAVARNPALIEGTLAYMSPEQTGRLSRPIDQRSDLYSLGVTFYEMLTGRLPFAARDALEWVHAHVARVAPAPKELVPALPEMLSWITMKLLAKGPEDRYQSAAGLRFDLERCLSSWHSWGFIEPFALGERDFSDRIDIPDRLYGRERELGALHAAFERITTTGRPALVLVSGVAGVGKSALVRRLGEAVRERQALFVEGRFEKDRRDVPYAALAGAFEALIFELLQRSDEEMAAWRVRLRGALGANAGLIVDLVPRLRLIIGTEPPVAPSATMETWLRFSQAVQKFVGVFATPEHPLVMLLDNLEWADAASLRLVRELVVSPDVGNLLVVGASRTPDSDANGRVDDVLAGDARAAGARVEELELGPLGRDAMTELLADALRCERDHVVPLSDLIWEKTGGNPFFAVQFLGSLHSERLIELDREAHAWRWDVGRIAAKGFTDNLADFLVANLRRLAGPTRGILMRAACVGSGADVGTLAALSGDSEAAIQAALVGAVRERLVVRQGDTYLFSHDRVREVAYSLLSDDDRAALHLSIGRRLYERAPPEARDDVIFDVVRHLNAAVRAITAPAPRAELALLDLRAGRKAKTAGAYGAALEYFAASERLLGALPEPRPELAFALSLEQAECHYLSGHLDEALRRLNELVPRAVHAEERVSVHRVRLMAALAKSDVALAVADELAGLSACGIELPARPTWEDAVRSRERVRTLLRGRSIDAVLDMREMRDPILRAAMQIANPSFYVDTNLWFLHISEMLILTLEHGIGPGSAFWVSSYGFALTALFDARGEARPFAEAGLRLVERSGDREAASRVNFAAGVVSFWTDPIDRAAEDFEAAYRIGVETGDVVTASYAVYCLLAVQLVRGDALDRLLEASQRYLEFVRRGNLRDSSDVIASTQQFIKCLRGRTESLATFDDGVFDEARFEAVLTGERIPTAVCCYWILKLRGRFAAGAYDEAYAVAEKAKALAPASAAVAILHDLHLFGALTIAARIDRATPEEKTALEAELEEYHAPMRRWAELNPRTFRCADALVAAEIARVRGRPEEAAHLYEESLKAARDAGFVQSEALAYERAAGFYRARGFGAFADLYLQHAHTAYTRWGADGKARQLEQLYPMLLQPPKSFDPMTTYRAPTAEIDLISAVNASQAISREVVFGELLERLLAVVLAQGGAERGCLLLAHEGTLMLEAEAVVKGPGTEVTAFRFTAADSSPLVPHSIVHSAWRSGETIVLGNAAAAGGRFSSDEYVVRQQPRSILCLPIRRQAEIAGLLYLENNVLTGAFTSARLTVLELLAAQAAISLENAQLYRQAEEAVRLREEFLTVASHELNTPMAALLLSVRGLSDAVSGGHVGVELLERLVTMAEGQTKRLERLIGEMLDVARLESGQFAVAPEHVELTALVREILARFELQIRRARCTLEVTMEGPIVGHWDPLRIDQVVSALLSNAMKFGRGGPIEVRVERARDRARLVVADRGIGIEPDRLPKVFERFARGVSARHYGGLGLGLYISRCIVDAHGGSIGVESKPGAGATFRVELPLAGPSPLVSRDRFRRSGGLEKPEHVSQITRLRQDHDRAGDVAGRAGSADDGHRDARELGVAPEHVEELPAVHPRHHQVDEHGMGAVRT